MPGPVVAFAPEAARMVTLQDKNRFPMAAAFPVLFTLIVGAIFGGSLVFLTPPFDVPEEWQHFFRGYQCSQRTVFATKDSLGVPGGNLPASLSDLSLVIHDDVTSEYDFRISVEKLERAASIPLKPGQKRFAGFPSTARFSPVPYLPAAVAMCAGRHARLSPLDELYLGRVSTLAAYLLLVAVAVWLIPVHKWLLVLVALMPMSIFLAASLSADALSIAFSLLAIALILRLALRAEGVGRGSLYWLETILLLLALAKPAYNLIAFLFLMVPKDKFSSRGQCWRVRAWMIGLPLVLSLAWAWSVRDVCVPYRPCADVNAQARWMLANPWSFTERVLSRLTNRGLYCGIVATLGWGTVWLASSVYGIYWTALLAAAALDGGQDEVRLPIRARALCIGVYVLVLSAIATLTFLWWHAVGEEVIHGVQSRYFVAVLPLLLVPLRIPAKWASSRFSRWLVPAVAIVTVLIGMGATWQAEIARFYWH